MKAVIDGRPLDIDGRPTILEAARSLGIEIPTLCYMPGLEPYAACRICLVEVRGSKNPVTACATPLMDGMEIVTNSESVRALRRDVLDLILSEHPSACLLCAEKPTCDESKSTIRKTGQPTGCVLCPADGRCDLQRVVAEVGLTRMTHPLSFRGADVRRDDPFIDRDDNLCILCGRCVRVCHEIRGADALAFIARGNRMTVGTSMGRTLLSAGCQFCGACVDVCPTGALTSRAVRYASRFDESRPFICGMCGQGCLLGLRLLRNRPVEVRPERGPANDGQACVKGRFIALDLIPHPRRITRPLIRRGGVLTETGWEEALGEAARGLAEAEGDIETVISAQDSCEDLWALVRLSREVLRVRRIVSAEGYDQAVFGFPSGAGAAPGPVRAERLADAQAFVVFEEPVFLTAPMFGLAMHRALRRGAKLAAVGTGDYCYERCASLRIKAGPQEAGSLLLALLRTMSGNDRVRNGTESLRRYLSALPEPSVPDAFPEKLEKLHKMLGKRKPAALMFGPGFVAGPWGARNAAALWNLARLIDGILVPVAGEANVWGALEIMRAAKSGPGSESESGKASARATLLAGSRRGFVRKDDSFVVSLDAFLGESAAQADVVLPRTTFLEQEGTYVNAEGRVQRSRAAAAPAGESRPIRLIAAELARALGAAAFPAFENAGAALASLAAAVPAFAEPLRALNDDRPAFLLEPDAPNPEFIEIPDPARTFDPAAGPVHRDPDDYLGLAAAVECKSLKKARRR